MSTSIRDLRICAALVAACCALSEPARGTDPRGYQRTANPYSHQGSTPYNQAGATVPTTNRYLANATTQPVPGQTYPVVATYLPQVAVARVAAASRSNRALCGRTMSWSANSAQQIADGKYRWLAQQMNCNSKF